MMPTFPKHSMLVGFLFAMIVPWLAGCLEAEPAPVDQAEDQVPAPEPPRRLVVQEDYAGFGRFGSDWCVIAACLSQGEPDQAEPIQVKAGRTLTGIDLEMHWDIDETFGTVDWALSCRMPSGSCDPGRVGQAEGGSPLRITVEGLKIPAGAQVEMDISFAYVAPGAWVGGMVSDEAYEIQGTVTYLE